MTKKLFPLIAILFLLIATPSFAKDNENSYNDTEVECDNETNWKNHGAFVSCVAHLHRGGTSVSTAAHSDIGKHDEDEDEDENDIDDDSTSSPTPTPSPVASPTPSASPTASPTPTPSPSPTLVTIDTETKSALGEMIQSLQAFITLLQNLIAG